MIPIIDTNRLILRAFQSDDLEGYLQMVGDKETMRFIGTGMVLDRVNGFHSMSSILGHWHLRGYGLWAVEDKTSGALVGRVGFYNPEGWPGLEIGWMIHRDYWGKGYATEAAQAALNWGMGSLNMDSVISCIQPANHPSIAVAERLGESFVREDRLQGIPILIYGISREDWQKSR